MGRHSASKQLLSTHPRLSIIAKLMTAQITEADVDLVRNSKICTIREQALNGADIPPAADSDRSCQAT